MRRTDLGRDDVAWFVLWVLITGLALLASYVIVRGPDLASERTFLLAEEMQRQDVEFCTQFGPPPKTHANVLCTMELNRIRQEDRDHVFSGGPW